MNFALPAITLLLLLLPGILAVQGFLGRIGRKTSDPGGQAGITWAGLVALLIAPVIHLSLTAVLRLFNAPPPDLHEYVTFDAPDEHRTYAFDVTFLTSSWRCIYGEGCQETSGAVVHVDDETVSVLTLAGGVARVPVAGVRLIERYDVLDPKTEGR